MFFDFLFDTVLTLISELFGWLSKHPFLMFIVVASASLSLIWVLYTHRIIVWPAYILQYVHI